MTKIYPLLLSLTILALLTACSEANEEKGSAAGITDIPALLLRPVALQSAAEWEQTQNGYSRLANELRTQDPQGVEPRITLAKIFINEARVTGEHGHYYPAALRMLDEAISLNRDGARNPNHEFDALAARASVLLSQHEFRQALATAREAVAINPYNAQVYGAIVDANVELGNYPEAIAAADKMNEIRPDLRSYSRVSYLREIHGDPDGAIEAMERAVRAGAPGYESTAWARLTLGELYNRYGQPDRAAEEYAAILRERPNYPFALAAQADLAIDAGDLRQAEDKLKEAISIIPEVGYYIQLAELYKGQGRTRELQELETDIMGMLEDDVASGHNMDMEYAMLYRDLYEDFEKALLYSEREYAARPGNIDVNRLMASVLMKLGKEDQARQHLAVAASTDSRHPELFGLRDRLGLATK